MNEHIELEDLLLIPKELTDEEWAKVKYNVDRKANPDIPLWRIQEAVKYAEFIAGHRGQAMLNKALSSQNAAKRHFYDDAEDFAYMTGDYASRAEVVFLRDIDGTGSMHPCAEGDSGAVEYVPREDD
jgi:hypothetical protein